MRNKQYVNGKLVSGTVGAYDFVYNIPEFMKRKRKLQCVILAPSALRGKKCPVCTKPVTDDNRTDLKKKDGKIYIACMHYACSWQSILNKVFVELPKRMGR